MREKRPIIALDFPFFDDVKDFLEHFPEDEKLYVKIGMEFFYAIGPEIVHYLKALGHSIFLGFEIARHSQYGALSHVCLRYFWYRHGDGPCSGWCGDDERS